MCSRWENGYYNYINKQNIKKHAENEINYIWQLIRTSRDETSERKIMSERERVDVSERARVKATVKLFCS